MGLKKEINSNNLPDFYYKVNQTVCCKNQDVIIINRYYKKEYGRNKKYYQVQCCKCNCVSDMRESTLKQNKGCPVCASKKIVKGINDIPTIAPWMVQYFPGGEDEASQYSVCMTKKIKFICPCCKKQIQKPIPIYQLYTNHSCGCQCETIMSFPERVMYNILEQNSIQFIHCATKNNILPWAKKYRYDFYLIDYNVIIETHGLQHYCDHGFNRFGGKTLIEEQNNDITKRKLALENGINQYFEIDCRKSDIEYILNSCINSGLFDYINININGIDPNHLFENIFSRMIKTVDLLIESNKDINANQLANELNVSVSLIKKILRIIQKDDQVIKRRQKATPVLVYKDDVYIATFKSFYDVYTNAKEILGVDIKTHDTKKYLNTGKKYLNHYSFCTSNNDSEVAIC